MTEPTPANGLRDILQLPPGEPFMVEMDTSMLTPASELRKLDMRIRNQFGTTTAPPSTILFDLGDFCRIANGSRF